MPSDLRDPENQTGHYDPKYDATPDQFDPGSASMGDYLQTISVDVLGKRMNTETLDKLKSKLDETGLFHQNPGDEAFRNKVKELLMARRITSKWHTNLDQELI